MEVERYTVERESVEGLHTILLCAGCVLLLCLWPVRRMTDGPNLTPLSPCKLKFKQGNHAANNSDVGRDGL